jgi:hypothetical protein
MRTFGTLVRDGTVSKGLLHTLQSEAASLATLAQTAPEAARAEMRRVFARQSSTDTPAADFDRTVGALLEQTSGQAAPLDAATDLLSIAQFIGMDGAP